MKNTRHFDLTTGQQNTSLSLRTCVAAALLALVCAGCAGYPVPLPPTTPLQASDSSVVVPTLRFGHTVGNDREDPAWRSGHGFEANLARASGEDTQFVIAEQDLIAVGGVTFDGPVSVEHEVDFDYRDIAYRWRYFEDEWGWEGGGGLGHIDLDLLSYSQTQIATDGVASTGVVGILGGFWRLKPRLSLQGRAMLFHANEHDMRGDRLELAVVWALNPNIALRAGLASWEVVLHEQTVYEAEMDFTGLTFGLDFDF